MCTCTVHVGIYVSSYKLLYSRSANCWCTESTVHSVLDTLILDRKGNRRLKVLLAQVSSVAKSGMVGKGNRSRFLHFSVASSII